MIYGLYLSATGVMTSSYRQDVIANNLANSETIGFKRDLALFQERPTEAGHGSIHGDWTNPDMEHIGGGLLATPTAVDIHQGELEPTGNNLDVAILGSGYFAVDAKTGMRLTRDGQFMVDSAGHLILANSNGERVLDTNHKPVTVDPRKSVTIAPDGVVNQNGAPIAKIGIFNVPNAGDLRKEGGNLMSYPDVKALRPAAATLRSEFIERANVDPATELASLMDAQRQLEANANMIRYQDQMLGKLVNEVGKIS